MIEVGYCLLRVMKKVLERFLQPPAACTAQLCNTKDHRGRLRLPGGGFGVTGCMDREEEVRTTLAPTARISIPAARTWSVRPLSKPRLRHHALPALLQSKRRRRCSLNRCCIALIYALLCLSIRRPRFFFAISNTAALEAAPSPSTAHLTFSVDVMHQSPQRPPSRLAFRSQGSFFQSAN